MVSKSFEELNEEMLKRLLDIDPALATSLGIHDPYDNLLPHGGLKKYGDTLKLLRDWSKRGATIASSENLDIEQRLCLKALDLSHDLLKFQIEEYPLWKMVPDATDPGNTLFIMVTRDYAPYETRAGAMSSRIEGIPTYFEQFRTRFKGARAVRVWTEVSIEATQQMPDFLRYIESYSKGRISDKVMANLRKNVSAAEEAVKVQLDWLNHLLDGAERGFAMGKKKFANLMKMRGLGLAPNEMLELGEKYLREFKEARAKVAERIAPGKGVEAAAAIVQSHSPRTFEEGLKATAEEMERAKRFAIVNDIASIDEKARLSVIETPAFMAPLMPYAGLFMSAKFDKNQEGAYIVTRPADPKDLNKHLNYASIINTAVHEAYPGHFHQGVLSNRKHWVMQLTGSGDVGWAGAETVEGWAHYCEKMMFDHGYEATDEAEMEMLNGAVWRACRIIADIKLAQGDATIDEMIDFIVKETGMAQDATAVEVKRYSRTPGQALSYMIGRHLIIQLREEIEAEMGSAFNEKEFHDLVASYGYLPYPLMREGVRAQLKI